MNDSSNNANPPDDFKQINRVIDDLREGKELSEEESVGNGAEELLSTMGMLSEAGRRETRDTENARADRPELKYSRFGDYEILREIGRGGMGLVFEARQISLSRRVALKVLLLRAMRDDEVVARFEREAQATASLEHPRIVRAYARGEDRGVYYLAMQFIDGQDLAEFIRDQRGDVHEDQPEESDSAELTTQLGIGLVAPNACDFEEKSAAREAGSDASRRLAADSSMTSAWTPSSAPLSSETPSSAPPSSETPSSGTGASYFRDIARIGQQVAEALQYAHENHVVHRDIKPSNLLLDKTGNIHIVDFGLAALENAPDLTATGKAFGTLRYSSPEQTRGDRKLDARTDVYSLGATLYELATLSPAFPSVDPATLLRDIQEREPIRPRKVCSNLPRDFESVILKAMSKDPRRRYQTALAFAADLQRFLRNEPVLAKRPTVVGQSVRWIQRNRLFSSLAAVILLLVLSGLFGVAAHLEQQERFVSRLNNSNVQLTQTLSKLDQTLVTERRLRQVVEAEKRLSRERYYAADLFNIASLANSGRCDLLPQRLQHHVPKTGEDDLRGFLWRYLRTASDTVELTLNAHDCKVLSTGTAPGRQLLVTGDKRGTIYVWDTTTWQQQKSLSFAGEVWGLEFSPDEKTLAVCGANGVIQLYETDGWKLKHSISAHKITAKGLKFTPDGKTLISCSRNHDIAYWDTETWREQRRFIAHNVVQNISMSSDGRWLASSGSDGWTKVWNVASGEQAAGMQDYDQTVLATALSSDGSLVAAGGYDQYVCLSDGITGERLAVIPIPGEHTWSLLFSPDDSKLMVGTGTGRICLYDVSDPRIPRLLKSTKTHNGSVRSLEWFGNTGRIITVSDDTTVCVSFLRENPREKILSAPYARAIRFAPDGEHFSLAHLGGGFTSWDRTGKQLAAHANAKWATATEGSEASQLGYTNSGWLWSADVSKTTARFSVLSPAGQTITHNASSRQDLQKICLSNDAKQAFALTVDGHGILWSLDAVRGADLIAEFALPADSQSAAFSPNNQILAVATDSGEVHLVDYSNTVVRRSVLSTNSEQGLYTVAFSPSGEKVATAGYKGVVYVWDVASGELKHEVLHQSTVANIAFSHDGRYLASAGRDLRLWNVDTGQFIMQLGPKYEHFNYEAIAFSPQDDCLIAVADQPESGVLHIWDVRESSAK